MFEKDYRPALLAAMSLFVVALAICAISYLTISFDAFTGGITVIWPVEGILLALMLGQFRDRPLAVLIVGETASIAGALLIEPNIAVPLLLCLSKAVGTWLIYYVIKKHSDEDRFVKSRILLIFIISASLVSIIFGITFSLLVHFFEGAPPTQFIFAGSATHLLGFAVLTPLLLILTRRGDPTLVRSYSRWRPVALVGAFSVLVMIIFAQSRYPLLYLIPIGFMGIAYTVDLKAVAVSVLITVVTATVMTLLGHGPISLVPASLAERVEVLQFFIGVMAATTLPIAALMAEHARLKQSLIAARIDAETANRAKSVFLATISHEIRTPLNGVLGMAQIMSMDQLSDVQRERVGVVRRSGETLLSLLNNVLDLSKIEAGKLTLEAIDFDLGDLLRDTSRAFETLAREKDVRLTLDLDGAEGVYSGDCLRVRQIVSNLISNALKFTASGTIGVQAVLTETGVRLAVSDTGIGIPADKIGALFSAFNQVDESTTRRFGGTGLGLSICRELVELMGGSIQVDSVEGEGSTFTAILPLRRVGDRTAQAEAAQAQAAGEVDRDMRVLAAEDNATNQLILKTLLELSGIEITIVENGAQAVEAWSESDWDMILMDVQMPVMDGPTATRTIRQREAASGRARTPIIALTANTMSHQVKEYIEAGMDGHLAKPIELSALLAVLAGPANADDSADPASMALAV